MSSIINFETLTFAIAILGTIFGVYHFFRNPDIKADKAIALLTLELQNLKDNHIHTLTGKVEQIESCLQQLTIQTNKLATIIDERIPKK